MRESAKGLLREGADPAAAKIVTDEATFGDVLTFEAVATTWFEKEKVGWVPAHQDRVWSRLQADVFPTLGPKQIDDITRSDVLGVVQAIEARGAFDVSRRARQTIRSIFKYAQVATDLIEINPAADIDAGMKPKPKVKHFAALKEKELPGFLIKLDSYDGQIATRHALKLTIQTMVRTQETRFARWSEFEDLAGRRPLWRIPPERMKMAREHLIPLARQTVMLLSEMRRYTEGDGFLFPTPNKSKVLSENTMLFALYRMGYHSRATVHGFRTTASTMLNEHGWNKDWIERQLSHDEEDEVRAAYNAAEYLQGRREMLQWWCDRLDKLSER